MSVLIHCQVQGEDSDTHIFSTKKVVIWVLHVVDLGPRTVEVDDRLPYDRSSSNDIIESIIK